MTQTHLATFKEQILPPSSGYKLKYTAQAVSFAAVFRDVTQRSPERNFLLRKRSVTSRKTAAKETSANCKGLQKLLSFSLRTELTEA